MVVRGIYPGRFQPPHLGHLYTIKWALEKVDELIIVVGTAQESHTLSNPFTAGERILMIKEGLKDVGVDLGNIYIIPVADIYMNAVWVQYVAMLVPPFKYAVSRNPLVVRLFKEAGYEVLVPPPYNRELYSSTKIRRLMLQGNDEWRKLVSPSIARIIDSIDGVKRLIEIAGRD